MALSGRDKDYVDFNNTLQANTAAFAGNNLAFWHASGDRSVSSNPWYSAISATVAEINFTRSGNVRKGEQTRQDKTSFVRQRQSSIKKDTTALHFPISCELRVSKKAGFTGTLRAKKSLPETPSTTLGKLRWMRASKEKRRSRIPLIVSNKSCGIFATGAPGWCREVAH